MSKPTRKFAKPWEPACPICGVARCRAVDNRHLENASDGRIKAIRGPEGYWTLAKPSTGN